MREIRTSGSEGGGTRQRVLPTPIVRSAFFTDRGLASGAAEWGREPVARETGGGHAGAVAPGSLSWFPGAPGASLAWETNARSRCG